MKSLKNKKCKICGKPAEVFLPNEDEIEEPYCISCANNITMLDGLDYDDDIDED